MSDSFCKKILASLLAASMAAGALAGCGGDGKPEGGADNNAGGESVETTTDADGREMVGNMYVTGLPIVKEKETFTMFTDDTPGEKIMYPILEEQTNVHVELLLYPYDIAKEKKNILINSGDYPDVIGGWTMTENEILTDGMVDGLYIQIDELIEKYAPRMQKAMSYEGVRQTMTLPDGHIYTIPYVTKTPLVPHLPWINQKWLDKLGLQMPATTDEFTEVLRAFKTGDPNGNGKNDEIPLSGDKENLNLGLYAGYWGKPCPNNYLSLGEDGKLEFRANTEEYKSAMKWLAGLYKEGLVDPEMFTHDQTQWKAKGNQQLYGATIAYGSRDFAGEALGPYEATDYSPLPVLKAPGVEKPQWRRDSHGISILKFQCAITDNAKNPATIIRWWDNAFEVDNAMQIKAGLFGVRCEKLGEGVYRELDESKLSEADRNKYGWGNMFTQSLPNFVEPEIELLKPEGVDFQDEKIAADKMYEPFLDELPPEVWTSTEDADRISVLFNDLDLYIRDIRAKWVSGQADVDADWDGYIAQLDKLGLEEYLSIKNKSLENLNQQ